MDVKESSKAPIAYGGGEITLHSAAGHVSACLLLRVTGREFLGIPMEPSVGTARQESGAHRGQAGSGRQAEGCPVQRGNPVTP